MEEADQSLKAAISLHPNVQEERETGNPKWLNLENELTTDSEFRITELSWVKAVSTNQEGP